MFEIYTYFIISILIHECAHIFIAKLYKINLKNLRVCLFGASLEIEKKTENSKLIKIIMYLAGPFANLFLAIIFCFLKVDELFKTKVIYTNLSLFALNLLPIIPLDGGNILRELLKFKFNNLIANKICISVSRACLGILSFAYTILIIKVKNLFLLLLIVYLWYLNHIEGKKVELLNKVYKTIDKQID